MRIKKNLPFLSYLIIFFPVCITRSYSFFEERENHTDSGRDSETSDYYSQKKTEYARDEAAKAEQQDPAASPTEIVNQKKEPMNIPETSLNPARQPALSDNIPLQHKSGLMGGMEIHQVRPAEEDIFRDVGDSHSQDVKEETSSAGSELRAKAARFLEAAKNVSPDYRSLIETWNAEDDEEWRAEVLQQIITTQFLPLSLFGRDPGEEDGELRHKITEVSSSWEEISHDQRQERIAQLFDEEERSEGARRPDWNERLQDLKDRFQIVYFLEQHQFLAEEAHQIELRSQRAFVSRRPAADRPDQQASAEEEQELVDYHEETQNIKKISQKYKKLGEENPSLAADALHVVAAAESTVESREGFIRAHVTGNKEEAGVLALQKRVDEEVLGEFIETVDDRLAGGPQEAPPAVRPEEKVPPKKYDYIPPSRRGLPGGWGR